MSDDAPPHVEVCDVEDGDDHDLASRLEEMRRAFDGAFARPADAAAVELADVLVVGVGEARVAVRASELAGIEAARPLVPLPGAAPGLLGIAGVRGRLIPVYGLAEELGRGASGQAGRRDSSSPGWLLLSAGAQRLGLAVDRVDRLVQVPAAELSTSEAGRRSPSAPAALRLPRETVALVSVAAMAAAIAGRAGADPAKEREP